MTNLLKTGIVTVVFTALLGFFNTELMAQRVRLEAQLRSTGIEALASGKAKFESRGDRMKFSAEAEDLLNTDAIDVFVDDLYIGSAVVDKFGVADLNLDTRLGDIVPEMKAGQVVEITNSKGTLLLFGVLGNRNRRGF